MSIFSKSVKRVFQKKNWRWIGGLSGLFTIFSRVQDFVRFKWWELLLVMAGSLVVLFIVFFIFYIMRNVYGRIHNMKVESILPDLHHSGISPKTTNVVERMAA